MIKIIENNQDNLKIINNYLSVEFTKRGENSGSYNISYSQDNLILCEINRAFCAINYYNSQTQEIEQFNSKGLEYVDEIEKNNENNEFIVILKPETDDLLFSFKIHFVLKQNTEFLLVKIIDIRDNNQRPVSIHSISPFNLENSYLKLNGTQKPTNLKKISWFKNG